PKFLDYSFSMHHDVRLRIAPESVRRLRQRVRALLRAGRGRSLSRITEMLKPLLRGWIHYFRLTQTKGVLEQLDSWLRRRLRCLLWRQWKRGRTRVRKLLARGLTADRAPAERLQRPWSVVECRRLAYESGVPRGLLHALGAGPAAGHSAAAPEC